MVQLHGQESASEVSALRQIMPGLPVIKAAPIVDGSSFAEALNVDSDYLLFDGPQPGSGTMMDWTLLDDVRHYPELPGFFLAGGLNVHNLGPAMDLGVYCLDVSSGVETKGVKDPAKIQEFISTLRRVHHPRSGS
jgi:phosphoribosylanthranilate isomerase